MEYLLALIALTVFVCWFIDNLWMLTEHVPNILKLIALAIGMYFVAKAGGIV